MNNKYVSLQNMFFVVLLFLEVMNEQCNLSILIHFGPHLHIVCINKLIVGLSPVGTGACVKKMRANCWIKAHECEVSAVWANRESANVERKLTQTRPIHSF